MKNNTKTNNMNTIVKGAAKFGFVPQAEEIYEVANKESYNVFNGFKTSVKYVMPEALDLNQVDDKVKLFSYNYSVAGAVGIITDGVYKFLAAKDVKELAKTVKDFGMEAKEGQRYTSFPTLIRNTKVVSRLGKGTMRLSVCSAYEVVEFFRRLRTLDINALTNEDLEAMKADMQVVGRVIQEIAIDAAKNKDLSSGIDPMNTFGSIKVLSKIRSQFNSILSDNRRDIFVAVRESVTKNQAINNGIEISSVPDYSLKFEEVTDKEFILDWAAKYQDALVDTQNIFMNNEAMKVVKAAGTTKEDLEIKDLVITNLPLVKEIKEIMSVFRAYSDTLTVKDHGEAEDNTRHATARKAADKEIKAAFRDTVYALGRAYGKTEAETRKLAYGATMLMKGGVNVANANMSCMDIIGEEDTLLMWSNEEGIVRDAVEVEIAEDVLATMDLSKEISFRAEFIDDVAYDEDGNEIAYGAFDNINGSGTIELVGHRFMFNPDRDTNIAPIGTKRVCLLNQIVLDGELVSLYKENAKIKELHELAKTPEDFADVRRQEAKLNKAIKDTMRVLLVSKEEVFFVGKTKAGVENAICARVLNAKTGKVEPATLGKSIAVGNGYGAELFNKGLTATLEDGRVVPLTRKAHKLDNIIRTDRGLLLILSC